MIWFIQFILNHNNKCFVGNKAKGWISKRVIPENKTRQIFRKNEHFFLPDTRTSRFKIRSFALLPKI